MLFKHESFCSVIFTITTNFNGFPDPQSPQVMSQKVAMVVRVEKLCPSCVWFYKKYLIVKLQVH